jgi:hypothetical protein
VKLKENNNNNNNNNDGDALQPVARNAAILAVQAVSLCDS